MSARCNSDDGWAGLTPMDLAVGGVENFQYVHAAPLQGPHAQRFAHLAVTRSIDDAREAIEQRGGRVTSIEWNDQRCLVHYEVP